MVRQKREWLAYVGRPVSNKKSVSSLNYREGVWLKQAEGGVLKNPVFAGVFLGCINIAFRMHTCDKREYIRCI